MAVELLGGAALGAAFGELLKAVLEIKDKASNFEHTLAYLSTTLRAIDPVIKEIEQHNDELGRPKEELQLLIKEMIEGTKLVYKCSKISKYNFPARIRYQDELAKLVVSLERFLRFDMQVQTTRDSKETLLKVTRILSAVKKLPLVRTEDTMGSSSVATDPEPLEIDVYDSSAMQPNAENETETDPIEEATELETLQSMPTQPPKDAAGTNSAEQVLEDITSLEQVSQASSDILLPFLFRRNEGIYLKATVKFDN